MSENPYKNLYLFNKVKWDNLDKQVRMFLATGDIMIRIDDKGFSVSSVEELKEKKKNGTSRSK